MHIILFLNYKYAEFFLSGNFDFKNYQSAFSLRHANKYSGLANRLISMQNKCPFYLWCKRIGYYLILSGSEFEKLFELSYLYLYSRLYVYIFVSEK